MNVALIHDCLNQYGRAERVLDTLLQIFPEADLYTLLYSKDRASGRFERNLRGTSALDCAFVRRYERLFLPLMALATQKLKLREHYDLVVSNSSGFANGVPHRPDTFHISYCHTPLPLAWEDSRPASGLRQRILRPLSDRLRAWDRRAAGRPDRLLAVSCCVAEEIRDHYGRTAPVLYPPVDYQRFHYEGRLQASRQIPSYYLAVGRLVRDNRFDLLIQAFRRLESALLIIGNGPDGRRLRALARRRNNVRIVNFVTDGELHSLYNGARALIVPQLSKFGMAAAEAQACGTPVIAREGGGVLEIVQDGVTGMFFRELSSDAIAAAVWHFETMSFDRDRISRLSQRFRADEFKQGILSYIPQELLKR